jgi:hypothetical protein
LQCELEKKEAQFSEQVECAREMLTVKLQCELQKKAAK